SASNPGRAQNVSFQNMARADQRVQELFDISLSGSLDANEWEFVSQCFQKRHLFAHKMGVVDQAYIDASGDMQAVVGRKVSVAPDEVTALIAHLRQLGAYLFAELAS
ncbi:MAG: hypothetical protein JW918_19525, partial [Anaerolineae bacterium]|nr:hypothetical protein [Anaerolineae bacterium]